MNVARYFTLTALALASGCVSYKTPGGAVQISDLADASINELLAKEPAAQFPARLSVARIQASGYQSLGSSSYGAGRYSVVTTRDVETEEDLARLNSLPGVSAESHSAAYQSRLDKSIAGSVGATQSGYSAALHIRYIVPDW